MTYCFRNCLKRNNDHRQWQRVEERDKRTLFPGARSMREQNDDVALFLKKQFSEKSVRRGFIKVFSEQLLRSYAIYSTLIQLFSQCQYHTQQTFQRQFNVAFRLVWRRDVAQRQNNVETTLCTSTLKFAKFNNVETTMCISTLNWTTLGNVETTLSFSTSIFTTLGNVETTLRIWPFEKKIKPRFKSKTIFLSFKEYAGLKIFFSFSPF